MRLSISRVAVTAVVLCGLAPAGFADLDVTDWELVTIASDADGPFNYQSDTSAVTPFTPTHVVTAGSQIRAETRYNIVDGAAPTLRLEYDHALVDSGLSDLADHVTQSLRFTATSDMPFVFRGEYRQNGTSRSHMQVSLYDRDDGVFLFQSTQNSVAGIDKHYILGGSNGDNGNLFTGSLSGSLIPGHRYEIFTNYFIQNSTHNGATVSANGFWEMEFNPVPSPGAALLGLLGGGMVAAHPRRRA